MKDDASNIAYRPWLPSKMMILAPIPVRFCSKGLDENKQASKWLNDIQKPNLATL